MAQQTGSISFEAVGGFSSYASGQFTTTEDVAQMSQPNLTPWFSVSVDDTSYWAELHARNTSVSNSEGLHGIWDGEDGWAHITLDSRTSAGNDGSKTCYMNMHVAHPKIADKVTAGGKYTWLIEVKNLTWIAGASGNALGVRPSVNNATLDVFNTCAKAFTENGAQWGMVTAKSDLSVLTRDTRGYCYIPTGCYADFDLRISLYEGEYEGPYKPYVDQSLITRVSTAETAIEQNAENILLRATKTEAQQMAQPNLSPWFSLQPIENDTEHWNINNGNTTFTPLEDGWVHLHNDNSSGTGVKRTDYQVMGSPSITPGADYTWLFEYRNNNSTGNNQNYIVQSSERVQFWGNNVVKVLEGKSGGATTTLGPNQDFPPETDGVYVKRVLKKAEAATSSHLDRTGTLYLGCLVCYAYAGAIADYDLRVSVYEGEYSGPYKPYSGAQLYASQAQLKVANDAISLKVSKNDVINQINVSTEGATIAANRVNVEGATIFTSGRLSQSSLNNAYDAKGAAATVQGNLDNLQVGGTNLLGGTANPSSKQIVLSIAGTSTFGDITNYNDDVTLYSFEDFDGYSNALKWTTSDTGNRGAGWYTKVGAIKAGERYTFSCKVMSSVATTVHTHTAWRNGSATAGYTGWTAAGSVAIAADEWTDYSYSFVPHSSAKLDWEFYVALCFSGNSGGATFRVAHPKLEKGNRPTDWSPAPEDIEANAVKRTQRIYYRTSSSTAPTSQYMPTAWVTETGDKWSASSTVTSNWTTKVTPIQDLSNASSVKCLYLFTCEQREMADGTIAYTNVLLDESTTVIDGGSIITNSIDANKLTVYDANIGKIKADAIDVSSIAIGDLDGASTVVSNAANGKSAYDRHTAYRGTCSTAAGTAAKVVACTGFALATGATVEVYCSTANTANVPTLNVNSTGAKAVWINGAVASASNPCKWLAGDTVTFTYDGTRFRASLPVEGYVTEGTGGGLMVHRKSDATTGVQITDSVEILQDGTSVAEYGATARIGKSDSGHIEISSDSLTVYADDGQNSLVKAATIKTATTNYGLSNALLLVDDDAGINYGYVYGTKYQYETVKSDTIAGIHAETTTSEKAHVDLEAFHVHGASSAAIGLTATEQDSEITLTADSISMDGTLTLTTPLADSNLPTKGSAGTAGTSSATSGATLAVPYVTTDAYGRVTAKGTHTHTIGSLAASAVTSGTFDAARIPNLNASKINAGTLGSARLPTVPIDKGGTGQTGVTSYGVDQILTVESGVTVSWVTLTKWGKLCQLTLRVSPSAAKTAPWKAATVAAGYRPISLTTTRPYHTSVQAAELTSDGVINVTACTAGASIPMSFTYLLPN